MVRPILFFVCSLAVTAGTGAAKDTSGAEQSAQAVGAMKVVDFTHEVRHILSANCFPCHGRDEEARQADLRLDDRQSAVDSGAIVPGSVGDSLLVERITSDDPDVLMPPPDSGHHLTPDQIRLLRQWIDQGAEYRPHWSFVPPTRPNRPAVNAVDWPANDIDYFVLNQLEEADLKPAPQAAPQILVRRLFLDLTGLSPTPEIADQFAAAPSLVAYVQLVDELLASPRFGEHWARVWLDLARYADTKGYEKDFPRDMWPYRDWVIQAMNEDMPYDQFTIEQLAGDLLPNPSPDQLIATAFHRNTMSNDEGGTDDEEFRVAAIKDRVDTTMQVWMGLTAGCAKCHSHKFDPISHEEYYQLFAVFNQTADADAADDSPTMPFATPEQKERLDSLRGELAAIEGIGRSVVDVGHGGSNVSTGRTGGSGLGVAAEQSTDANQQKAAKSEASRLEQQITKLESAIAKLPIMRERSREQRRITHIQRRGNFLDPGEEVSPAVPSAFGRLADDVPHDRLALAKWLVSNENPLTARVAANRVWARFFGTGLVESEGDFGTQGAEPSHPQLLDWIATELRDTHHWSIKKLCKTIVMSATYRQSSVMNAEKLAADPQNRLLGRGATYRLPAETVRDQALAAAVLLSAKMFGPPVMPPQPAGVWKSIYNASKWDTSVGEDRYRRSIYTYWKRTSPYPAMLIFDAESREVCSIRRLRTNTPLQALVLMNDPVYLEAAVALVRRMINEGGDSPKERIERGFRLVMIRPPTSREVDRLDQLRIATERKLAASPGDAEELLKACNAAPSARGTLSPPVFAAYAVVASVILNLDESITRG